MNIKGKTLACAALFTAFAAGGCACNAEEEEKLVVWVSESDKDFANEVAAEFVKQVETPVRIVVEAQGENDVATRVLKDVEKAADVYSFVNDQLPKLVGGDALAKIAGARYTRLQQSNEKQAVTAATLSAKDEDCAYGFPYTDNTFFLYYDKSKLTAEDVATFDGILAKCGKDKQFAFPLADGWYSTSFYFGAGLSYAVTYDNNLAEQTISTDFGSEKGVAVTEAIWSYAQNAGFKGDANDSKITAGFADGSVIAAATGIWNRTAIEGALKENFAAAKLPSFTLTQNGSTAQTSLRPFAGYKLMGVNNYSKRKILAMDFAEFYTNAQNQWKHYEARGFVPTNIEAKSGERLQGDVCAKAITAQLLCSKTQVDVPSTLWLPMEGLGSAMLTGVQSGSFNVRAQLKACVDGIQKSAKSGAADGKVVDKTQKQAFIAAGEGV